jgi:type II secretory pathway pseudopilin PulG
MIELLLVCLLFAFLVAATSKLYHIGEDQQRTARFYSDAQATCREALRRIVKTARHGYAVESGVTVFYNNVTPASGSSQVIFTTPQANNTDGRWHIRFYVSGDTLYAQRSDDTTVGEAIATGVQTFTVNYFVTTSTATGTTTAATDGTPTAATEVQFTLTLKSGTATVTRTAYCEMRNTSLGL